MEVVANRYENDLNFKATELRLGLPGTEDDEAPENKQSFKSHKRSSPEINCSSYGEEEEAEKESAAAPPKAQVIGWPPVRSYRKNAITTQQKKTEQQLEGSGIFVKVSMDGAPYLRKIDLRLYKSYSELVKGLESMFKCNIGEYHEREGYGSNHHDHFTPTYEDKDGDWMLVGDVPWDMFLTSCKRMRIMKSSDANGIICS